MLHGCEEVIIPWLLINAVVLNGAKIVINCVIGANALGQKGMQVPDYSVP